MTVRTHERRIYTADEIADLIGVYRPTPEQREIIESPLDSAVVIAGAGSGKTTVIALRVVYLVANGLVPAPSILGLTFTRKAVGELNERIRDLLARFRANAGSTDGYGSQAAGEPSAGLQGLDVPAVTTYNSFAAALVGDHGIRLGIEPDTRVIDIAESMSLAAEVVDAASSAEIPQNSARSTMIADIISLSGEISDHLRSPADVLAHLDESIDLMLSGDLFVDLLAKLMRKKKPREEREAAAARLEELAAAAGLGEHPARGGGDPEARERLIEEAVGWGITSSVLERLQRKRRLCVLAERFARLKRERSAMEFSDQVAFAHRLVTEDPDVLHIERSRWSVILLDEYQDTSDSQFQLLKTMFAGLPVMAVGDPRQSIYAWRGASARNIGEFPLHFRSPDGSVARTYGLSTSWRNDEAILGIANAFAAPLPDGDGDVRLAPRPGAGAGQVRVSTTVGLPDEEFGTEQWAELAGWMTEVDAADPTSTKAVLCRKRADFGAVATALQAAGFEVRIVGSTGMLDDPAVADLHCALHVLVDPGAGDMLMRLLSGATCGLGAADIAALSRFARARSERLDGEDEQVGLVECIDDLLAVRSDDAADGPGAQVPSAVAADLRRSGLTREATRRVTDLAHRLRRLRRSMTTVAALVRDTIRGLDIDMEVEALGGAAGAARRTALDSYLSKALEYTAAHPHGDVPDFLEWLGMLEAKDALGAPESEPDPQSVTIMTIHASKGLEFDAVAIPGLTEGDLPTSLRETSGWLSASALPYPLRGDHSRLPSFDLRSTAFSTHKELDEHIAQVVRPELEEHHVVEERRLAYVAVTRARAHLWLGAALFTSRKKANTFSPFLKEAMAELGIDEDTLPDPDDAPADDSAPASVAWPVRAVEATAQRARAVARMRDRSAAPVELADLAREAVHPHVRAVAARAVDLLEEARAPREAFALPGRISTTGIVSFASDPRAFARRTVRPMPYPPNEAAGLGTAFHAWIERGYGQAALGDADVEEAAAGLSPAARRRFDALREVFERSEYSRLEPLAVELPFELLVEDEDGAFHVPGKIDAVFAAGDGIRIVDWKTGSAPGPDDLEAMTVQLSVYALALSRMPRFGDRQAISAEFFFLGSDEVVRPERLHTADEIARLLREGQRSVAADPGA